MLPHFAEVDKCKQAKDQALVIDLLQQGWSRHAVNGDIVKCLIQHTVDV